MLHYSQLYSVPMNTAKFVLIRLTHKSTYWGIASTNYNHSKNNKRSL